ncbi:hypothetical protein [Priestia koreensis]|uniref:hypothetical protein n=1 Tax=Priestia koreensis TaxID=284581 RepID=UPI001F58E5FB|nr:hypothetical protein [Priestia koreensis]UNL83683.1 hypothetical protein IE339_16130 [Priestia koreensis]
MKIAEVEELFSEYGISFHLSYPLELSGLHHTMSRRTMRTFLEQIEAIEEMSFEAFYYQYKVFQAAFERNELPL